MTYLARTMVGLSGGHVWRDAWPDFPVDQDPRSVPSIEEMRH